MKIRNKIALFYTFVTFIVLLGVFILVYFITTRAINQNFYTYLEEKAFITAEKHFEEDEVSRLVYESVLKNYSLLLPDAEEIVLDAKDTQSTIDSLKTYISARQIKQLYQQKNIKFRHDHHQGFAIYYPDNEGDFIVAIMAHNQQGEYIIGTLLKILITVFLIALLFVYCVGLVYARQILHPLKQILKSVRQIRGNNLHNRIEGQKGGDELTELVSLLNQMLDRLELAFNSQKAFISNASHELNNPLTAIIGECEIMQLQDFTLNEYKDAICRIDTESQRLKDLIHHLLRLVQTDLDAISSASESTDVYDCLLRLVAHFDKTKYAGRIRFETNIDENNESHFTYNINPDMLWIALQNLIENACKYSGNESVIVHYEESSTSCLITIKDQGIGIPTNEIKNIFQPFYRGSNTYQFQGFGIGLSLSEKIIILNKGNIRIQSVEGKGSLVSVEF